MKGRANMARGNAVDISVNGILLHYEVRGEGAPLVLLHGNGESLRIFDEVAAALSSRYTVYAVDSRGHGKSERAKPLHYTDMRDDVIALIRQLGLDKPALYGFSDGGIVGLMTAIAEPNLLGKLIVSGANLSPAGMNDTFNRVVRWVCRLGGGAKWRLMRDEPNVPQEELRKITVPTVVLAGENDLVKSEHTALIASNIEGCTLSVLNGEGHSSYVLDGKKLLKILEDAAKI